jgi:RHS repeat-associated protein
MKFTIQPRIIAVVLAFTLLISLYPPDALVIVNAESADALPSTSEYAMERFGVSQSFLTVEQEAGYSIHQIYAALYRAEWQGISYEEARQALYPAEINLSAEAVSEVKNAHVPIDLVIRDHAPEMEVEGPEILDEQEGGVASSPAANDEADEQEETPESEAEPAPIGTQPEERPSDQPEQVQPTDEADEQEETPESEAEPTPIGAQLEERPSDQPEQVQPTDEATEDVDVMEEQEQSGEGQAAFVSRLAGAPFQEQAPVYSKSTINQAPYSINREQESISTLSGDLSLHQTDMSLPGRNGLSFALTRQYDSSNALLYDIDYRGVDVDASYDEYYVAFDAIAKRTKYAISYKESMYFEEDRNGDGTPDYFGLAVNDTLEHYGTYSTLAEAEAAKSDAIYYSKSPAVQKPVTDYREGKSGTVFPNVLTYNADGFSGTLSKSGSLRHISGSYSPADTKQANHTCTNNQVGVYNASRVWVLQTESPCGYSFSYSVDGYSGSLARTGQNQIRECPPSAYPGYICTKIWEAYFSGNVTKPATPDTRVYRQDYSGMVTKPEKNELRRYEGWVKVGNVYERKAYYRSEVDIIPIADPNDTGQAKKLYSKNYATRLEAEQEVARIRLFPMNIPLKVDANFVYFRASSSDASVETKRIPATGTRYENITKPSQLEQRYPLGKGWSWKLPFVETDHGKTYVHLVDGGRYEVENGTLKDYAWQGLSFTPDTSLQVNGDTSAHRLSSVDGLQQQYFNSDGRLLQIKDTYNNTISFGYTQHADYGIKLLSSITDDLNNTIQISYSAQEVRLEKGDETVVYLKSKKGEKNTEVLESVLDAEGRKTTYNYRLYPAKFNLLGYDEGRALSNPYLLLENVKHPTGATTFYEFESAPVKRYIGSTSFIEAYRISKRSDQVAYANNTTRSFNVQTLHYPEHYAKSYGQSYTFSTKLQEGLLSTTFNYRKAYVDESQPTQYYLDSQTVSGDGLDKTTTNTYDKKVGSRSYAVTYPTTVVTSDNKTSDRLTTSKEYDDYGNVIRATDALGAVTTNLYDPVKKWLTSTLQQVGANEYVYTSFSRNAQGSLTDTTTRRTNETGEVLRKTSYEGFDAHGNATTITVVNGSKPQVYTITYDQAHQAYPVKQEIQVKSVFGTSQSISTQFEYDAATGRVRASIDGEGNETVYGFDRLGRVTSVNYPGGHTMSAVYDDVHNKITVTDELGRQSWTQYNALGWKQEEGVMIGSDSKWLTRTEYNAYGQVERTEEASGNFAGYAYDAWSRPTKVTAPNTAEATIEYLDALRQVVTTDAMNNRSFETFDPFGRSIQMEEQAVDKARVLVGLTSYYPLTSKVHEQIDAKQESTVYGYDVWGQLTSVKNALDETTQYLYDQLGNHVRTIFPDGGEENKQYDELGRLIENKDAMGQKETYEYDKNGNRSRLVDKNGQSFTYTYNSRNWLTGKQGTAEMILFDYYADGSRMWMMDQTGTTEYVYKPYTGELEKVTYPDGKNIQYAYNDNGQRTQMTTPFGDVVGYDYNERNQLKTLSWNGELESEYMYTKSGLLLQAKQGGVVEAERVYDNGLLKELKQTGLQGSFGRMYTYERDANKNISIVTEENEQSVITRNDSYGYDVLNRVETASPFQETYTYDSRGNRSTKQSNQILSVPIGVRYTYDQWDRLNSVAGEDGTDVTYKYNGDNLMVERTENGTTTRYYYDGYQIIAEGTVTSNRTVNEKVSYLRGHGLSMLEEADGTKGYYVHNGHGDVETILGEQGQTLNSYTYDLWGKPLTAEEQVANSFRYSGEYWDEATDLQYLRARWYDPRLGRFINEDTYEGELGNPLSQNLYAYVENNPLIYMDPSGMAPVLIGHIYVIEGPNAEVYIGSTAQDIKRRMNGHKWAKLVTNPGTVVRAIEVNAELDVAASNKGTKLAARNEALRSAEQEVINKYRDAGASLLNDDEAATEKNQPIWKARHSVKYDINSETVALKGGKRVSTAMGIFDFYGTYMAINQSQYEYAPYYMQDQGGVFTIGYSKSGWFSSTKYFKTYESGTIEGISRNDYDFWREEGRALWGYLNGWGNFVPGLFNPSLDDYTA